MSTWKGKDQVAWAAVGPWQWGEPGLGGHPGRAGVTEPQRWGWGKWAGREIKHVEIKGKVWKQVSRLWKPWKAREGMQHTMKTKKGGDNRKRRFKDCCGSLCRMRRPGFGGWGGPGGWARKWNLWPQGQAYSVALTCGPPDLWEQEGRTCQWEKLQDSGTVSSS